MEISKFICDICNKEFKKEHNFNKHKNEKHINDLNNRNTETTQTTQPNNDIIIAKKSKKKENKLETQPTQPNNDVIVAKKSKKKENKLETQEIQQNENIIITSTINKVKKTKTKKIDLLVDEFTNVTINNKHLKPLIKWSGGKSDEIKLFEKYIPSNYDTYLEPFIGGGSVYFYTMPKKAVISDVHSELIDFYKNIKAGNGEEIYNFMNETNNDEGTYYQVRDIMEIKDSLDNAILLNN
jgi:hypothetical protein